MVSCSKVSQELQFFILRSHALRLYRSALRTARRAPPHSRGELEHTIREEMERNRSVKDLSSIRFLISEGMQRLKELNAMLDNQGY
ncbi:hypothetical protein KP509_36G036500 [Ceratopteris richardii]|uniref:LYR motif-containing protein 2 n=1 Tax=Ceratopteris richardii TaxID=49495 RepID=A0A8T2QC24_CERRI|nr:hypothetical protein KP509_36G036500 [Ceratopteris richardii]